MRLLGIITLIILALIVVSSGLRKDLYDYLERGTQFFQESMDKAKEKLKGVWEKEQGSSIGTQKPQELEEVRTDRRPFHDLLDQGIVDEHFPEKGPFSNRQEPLKPSITQKRAEEKREGAKKEVDHQAFPRLYDYMREKLFQAMEILEGNSDEN